MGCVDSERERKKGNKVVMWSRVGDGSRGRKRYLIL